MYEQPTIDDEKKKRARRAAVAGLVAPSAPQTATPPRTLSAPGAAPNVQPGAPRRELRPGIGGSQTTQPAPTPVRSGPPPQRDPSGAYADAQRRQRDSESERLRAEQERARQEQERRLREKAEGMRDGKNTPPLDTTNDETGASNDEVDQEIANYLRDKIKGAGNVNTAEQEKLINEQQRGLLGEGLVGARAAMGRSGFGASGAIAGIEGGIRTRAAREAAQQILDERTRAQSEADRNAMGAIGAETSKRSAASQEELRRAALDLLGQELDDGAALSERDAEAQLERNTGGVKQGDRINTETYSYQIESGKRNDADLSQGTVTVDGVTYQRFSDRVRGGYYVVAMGG